MLLSSACSVWLYRTATTEVRTVAAQQQTAFSENGQPVTGAERIHSIEMLLLDSSKDRLRQNLLSFNLSVFGASILLSYLLARLTLRPIRQSYEKQQQFAANASHELRTPLTSLKTELQVAQRSPQFAGTDAQRVLEGSLEDVRHLTAIIEKLLRMSRSHRSVAGTETDVHAIATVVREHLMDSAGKKDITIALALPHVTARIDQDELRELLTILVENAIKYCQPSASIRLSAVQQRKRVMVIVSDNGPGISEVDITRIFERSYRATSTEPRPSGHGLGLAIAYEIATSAGGRLSASNNTPKPGMMFTLELPA